MAATLIEPSEKEQTATQTVQPQAPQAPAIDSAAAVSEAARIVAAQQAAAVAARPAELSPDLQAWVAEVAQRGCASAGEVVLWLVATVTFLAITSFGIWLNGAGMFPQL
ncbi:MAG TPA: hypothetical protein VK009_21815 [Chloroflexota bacterium]|nr:hypothetical protein [Chloroflexota bacterium]